MMKSPDQSQVTVIVARIQTSIDTTCAPIEPDLHCSSSPAEGLTEIMLSRSATLRHTLARQAKLQSTRNYAAASGSFAYKTGDANGIKFASRDQAGPVTTVALVAKAGTRYEFLPGLAEGLDRFAFKVRRD